ncbi:sensor histidine kinase [Cohnella thailandensis]|uniref:Sensor histidine kinase n=1 Tax=Cohnella thailandensis TaxID=557557 RepID=A0A841SS35_9BACL|nr:sensor histidine kinase [Cohnella thailandensis]MBB6632875.1 sensor histidine kinase [Cohnella thailandensis]MBP1975431.1 two-component system sensor histidine kinase YesM [Cohnella thailandensis]
MSHKERSLFSKLVGSLILLLLPVLILSVYSHSINEKVITSQIKQSSIGQLSTLAAQMDNIFMQLETFSRILLRDPNVIEFQDMSLLNYSYYEQISRKKIIQDKLYLQVASTDWTQEITVYSPRTGQTISTARGQTYDPSRLRKLSEGSWNFPAADAGDEDVNDSPLLLVTVEPYEAETDMSKANSIVEISFDRNNIVRMLNRFEDQGGGDVLFYKPEAASLASSNCPQALCEEAAAALGAKRLPPQGDMTLSLGGISYLLTYSEVASLQGYVVNVVPLSDILTPLRTTNRFSYLVYALLLVVGIAVAWVLYRNVQVPLRELVKGVQKIKMGQYKTRIPLKVKNEFRLIISRFNEMAGEIQRLIENVLEQKLHTREAELKQLQSQINPHFLYNSLSYIIGMTKLDRKDAVLEMAYHLSDYYRYSTRVQNQQVKLRDELKNAADYLSIHRMRMNRIRYEIDVEADMLELKVPRLILQPIVENALIHGIESLEGIGKITISGRLADGACSLSVDDNGGAMTPESLSRLNRLLAGQVDERSESCGLVNVHRRLRLRYGAESGLKLSINAESGLRAELYWREEADDGEAVDRGR